MDQLIPLFPASPPPEQGRELAEETGTAFGKQFPTGEETARTAQSVSAAIQQSAPGMDPSDTAGPLSAVASELWSIIDHLMGAAPSSRQDEGGALERQCPPICRWADRRLDGPPGTSLGRRGAPRKTFARLSSAIFTTPSS